MREFLFRGVPKDKSTFLFFQEVWKDCCDGNFVKGSLIYSKGKYYICLSAMCQINSTINNGKASMIEVIPETVGQYTGLTDKNGKQIFEGDIVNVQYETEYVGLKPKPSYMGVVEFKDGAFGIYESGKGTQFFFQHGLIKTVIGNIHDNPELLKGGEGDGEN